MKLSKKRSTAQPSLAEPRAGILLDKNQPRKGKLMAMTTLEYDLVYNAAQVCSMILSDLQPKLASFQQLYDSAGGIRETLTQADLDSVPALSALTVAQVTDALYVLTTVLLPGITSGYTALSALGARYRGFAPAPLPMMGAPVMAPTP